MPAPTDTLVRPETSTIEFKVDPVYNALHSLMLINKADHLSGLSEWVLNTHDVLTPAELADQRLLFEGIPYAYNPKRQWSSFPAFLDNLEKKDPLVLRDRLLDAYFDMSCRRTEDSPYKTYEDVLQSPDSYVDFLIGRFGAEYIDEELERLAYSYVTNPEAMKEKIVSHLRMMWDRFLAEEWARVQPMIEDSAAAFNTIDLKGMSFREATEFVSGQSLQAKHWDHIEQEHQRLIFVPSAHVGPYLGKYHQGDAFIVIFGARLPEGATMHAPDLSRNEIVVLLSALADDTRLRILRFIADNDEQRSQDIMNELDLSQSAASRHLKQLSATGYLTERRCEGAKCYSLSEDRLRDTFQAALAFLAVTP